MYEHSDYCADSTEVWRDELPDGSLGCARCLEIHPVHASCTLSPLQDAVSLSPRLKSGITGSLSLHDYRKYLSQEYVADPVDRSDKTLKRKTATVNLNRPPAISALPSCAVSVSSVASSPPPLSPSYSHSILSQRSEQEPESLDISAPSQSPRDYLVSEHLVRPRPNRKRLNPFLEKHQKSVQARDQAQPLPQPRPQKSDPMLANTQAVSTISHGGASFEILNPRKSLDISRIVSFIEDVDCCSVLSLDPIRDSKVSTTTIDLGLDRCSLSQFTDASLPSHYSSHSLWTPPSKGFSTPKRQTSDIPSSSPGVHGRARSLSDYSIHEQTHWSQSQHIENELHEEMYPDLIRDSPNHHITSITERSEETENEDESPCDSPRPPSSPKTLCSDDDSEIGEPGSPVYANGEWAQVDERDRGIFFEEPPSPYDIYYENTMPAHIYSKPHDPYDLISLDPHVQSVLAAANAETMGLRGHPTRALDDLQRKSQGKLDDRKRSSSQKKRLRKFFSWRSGN
ncbi:hypothetical protein N7448_004578 [Penicillium atrosanguineum]|uniref:G/U mismatch-specific uracil DNA glycosylase n=1 Tax=Penicillium atrosanguineum TaxID=1132637 RepID=UPI0023A71D3B|nr:G/U mismatch-specific uracil DNA glycosylase [Penicillium atrosanguineum]KAJ5125251.1 hypothetical protein N7526_007428 [Penicillium atrosanguineum]KAJ5136024.1 hypothetical protein N7448_004578 [Penicillium atrosanguineum]KAJ5292374.1 G/U mismatch-specific uracil DNA glycosylase [Penicillium atrosanguineum]